METKSLGNCSGGYGETDAKYTVFRSKFGKPAILDNADSNIPLKQFYRSSPYPTKQLFTQGIAREIIEVAELAKHLLFHCEVRALVLVGC